MYNGLCCFCESNINLTDFGAIEHRMPKKKFPEFTYSWDNLHLVCTICNTRKGTKYSKKYPILDAVADNIYEHMIYEPRITGGVFWKPISKQGQTTEDHTKLNRKLLREGRTDFYLGAIGLIEKIHNDLDDPNINTVLIELSEMKNGQFGSVIAHAMKFHLKIEHQEND